jgi:hypothetical protein
MVTVHRAYGFRFVMYANDHSPAHVHISRADLRRIMEETELERERLIEAWRMVHD